MRQTPLFKVEMIFGSKFLLLLLSNLQMYSCSFPTVFDLSAVDQAILNNPNVIKRGYDDRPVPVSASPVPAPVKRARSSPVPFIFAPNLTVEYFIEHEMKTCSYRKSEKKEGFKRALELIAANDIDSFIAYEKKLLGTFDYRCISTFYKDEVRDYLVRFMVLFGADKFFEKYGRKSSRCGQDIEGLVRIEMIGYLIDTKSLDVVLNILLGFKQIKFTGEMVTKTVDILNLKYSKMNFFQKLVLRMLKTDHKIYWSGKILSSRSELEAFKVISSEIRNNSILHYDFFLNLPFEMPQLYLQCTDQEKFEFIHAMIVRDDIDKIEKIIVLDLGMISFMHRIRNDSLNLMDYCMHWTAPKCFTFLLEIIPEMVSNPTKFPCTLGRAVKQQNLAFLDILLLNGFGVDSLVKESADGKQFSLIQYAFFTHKAQSLNHFVIKFGLDRVKADIYAMWPTIEDIARNVLVRDGDICNGIVDFAVHDLGINRDYIVSHLNIFTEHLRQYLFRGAINTNNKN